MSGGWVAAGVVATMATSIYTSNQQDKAQRRAADEQRRAAAEAKKQQEMEFNRANQNEVDVSGILGRNQNHDGMGSATMITGPGGAKLDDTLLGGGSTLLGG